MFKLFVLVLAAILAVAAATPGVVSAYSAPVVSAYGYNPVAYSSYGYGYPYGYGYNGYSSYPYAYNRYFY